MTIQRLAERLPSKVGQASPAQYRTVANALEEHAGELQPLRMIVLSSFTTDFWDPFVRVEAARFGYYATLHRGGFGQFEEALLSTSDLPRPDGDTELLVVALRPEDLSSEAVHRFYRGDTSHFDDFAGEVLERIHAVVDLFRERGNGPVLVANFAQPEGAPLGIFEANDPASLLHRIHGLNRDLARGLGSRADTYVWDYAGLVASMGARNWSDPRMMALARAPVATPQLPYLARHLMRTARSVLLPPAKCLVLDLDNTLWGGAIGDDGLGGIELGDDGPGVTFKRFQRAVMSVRDRGILLAISSKNDEEVVSRAFQEHPEMLIRPSDVSAWRINWGPKSAALREIADELNIGVDSLVFFDDNPVERAEVRASLPEVTVVDVPGDPAEYVDALFEVPELDTPMLTEEDRARADFYQARQGRAAARAAAPSLQEFLASLDMEAVIGSLDDATAPRIAQLVAKTNQFNLTTRRHTRAHLEEVAQEEHSDVYWLRLSDRYGDHGLVGVAVLEIRGNEAWVETLLMSCRVANRGVEQAMVAHLATTALEKGCTALVGEYLPTDRNGVVKDLYLDMSFTPDPATPGLYRLNLDEGAPDPPRHIRVQVRTSSTPSD